MSQSSRWWRSLTDRLEWFGSMHTSRHTNNLHTLLYTLSRGLIGGKSVGLPVLLLTSTGRKSHQPRTVPLSYLADGTHYVLCASNSGRDEPPNWYLNLKADPHARVCVKGRTIDVVAMIAGPGDKERLWQTLISRAPIYDRYKARTSRNIDMAILRPTGQGRN